ncbi:MAG: response regulator, partial [Pseudomonadota bacterium]|nr:response regulator [Pseudomonadota bacterium]
MSARILVVDDILPNVKLLEAKLVSEYYDVITATNGEDALRRVKEDGPDLVLLDVMMPGMDGFEVCKRIKEDPQTSHVPVVMVTALTDVQDRVKGLESGADDFLSKPINDTALMARVRSLVRLKMTIDEWRVRSNAANTLGVMDDSGAVMNEPVQGAQLLLVEDQDFEVDKIKSSLASDDNIIIQARSGMQALEYAREREFDLIAISLNLGGEDGLRLCSHIRSNERTRQIPIIMIASPDDMPRVAHGLEIG